MESQQSAGRDAGMWLARGKSRSVWSACSLLPLSGGLGYPNAISLSTTAASCTHSIRFATSDALIVSRCAVFRPFCAFLVFGSNPFNYPDRLENLALILFGVLPVLTGTA